MCTWKEDEDGVWDTGCLNRHEFIEGGPTENKYTFCPYCGEEIEVSSYLDTSEVYDSNGE